MSFQIECIAPLPPQRLPAVLKWISKISLGCRRA
jgi:hypothetical protein